MQTVETLNEGLKRAYTLKIAAKDIEARVHGELKKVAPQIRMPGFRPGKVPANLVRKMHGPALEQQALETAVQEGVQQLLAEKNLRPAMQPSVELDEGFAPGKDAEVKVSLEVLPDVPVAEIDGLKLERLTVPVEDSEIDETLKRIAAGNKQFEAAEKTTYKAKTGDLVVIDFVGKVDGVEFEGGKGEGVSLELGSGQFIPGFEDQLGGVKANDQKTVNVTFPEDYGAAHLAGKAASFDVTVNEVRTPKETALDDEFAKQLGLEGIDKLRELIKGQLEQEHNGLTRTHMKRKLLDQLAAAHDFDVPPSMVDAEFNQIWAQLEHEASHEPDPAKARGEMEADRDDYRRIAERRVRLGLLLSDIGTRNNVEITPAEMNRLIAQAAQQYRPEDRDRFVQYIRQEPMAAAQLRAPLFEDKVVDFIFSKADITDRSVTRAEIEAEIEADEDGHVHGPGCGHDHHDHDHEAAKPKAKKAAAKKPAAKSEADAGAVEAEAPAKPKKAAAKKAAPAPEAAVSEEAAAEAAAAKPKRAKKAAAK
ncbi:trigger factor [Sphingomonas sp. MAH-20]|uniref:Trigger factor n=1 Tax=Sphingomonas horti TaxID=2682842 RepID=A0A6I4J1G2_9SPHN|nr:MULTISPECIES: trigger factor [Sphingomonas]MBA2920028.1 trigger factor [Sphingomonas sp. CGMCC 1.13658]MVO77908.1 trigger factor [Sphingomonas horti]